VQLERVQSCEQLLEDAVEKVQLAAGVFCSNVFVMGSVVPSGRFKVQQGALERQDTIAGYSAYGGIECPLRSTDRAGH
jgi:hypothetical protein